MIKWICWATALLLSYAAISKLANYQQSRSEMLNQLFAPSVAVVLVWLVPMVELLISGFLIWRPLRIVGLWASIGLLLLFSCYITLSMSGIMGKRPCSCGGILNGMGYGWHLGLNLIFIALGCWAVRLHERKGAVEVLLDLWERRPGKIG